MRNSILVSIIVAVVLTGGATFFITKSVCSNNSESQVVAYLKEKEAEERARTKKQLAADATASKEASEAYRKLDERMKNPNWYRDSQKEWAQQSQKEK